MMPSMKFILLSAIWTKIKKVILRGVNMEKVKYDEVIEHLNDVQKRVCNLIYLFNDRDDLSLELNKTRALLVIDGAIKSLNGVKRTVETEIDDIEIDIVADTAEEIVETLKLYGVDDVTASSGYFLIKEFPDGSTRTVDAFKAEEDGNIYYVVCCKYEDDTSEWKQTQSLSIEELKEVIKEFYESEV